MTCLNLASTRQTILSWENLVALRLIPLSSVFWLKCSPMLSLLFLYLFSPLLIFFLCIWLCAPSRNQHIPPFEQLWKPCQETLRRSKIQPTVEENSMSSSINLLVKHLIKSHALLNNKKIHASQTRLNKTSITSRSGVLTAIYWHAQHGNVISVTSEMRKSHMSVWLQSIPPPPLPFTTDGDVENKLRVAFNLASKLY